MKRKSGGYRGVVVSDWDRVRDTRKGRLVLRGALQAFMDVPSLYPALRRQARDFAKTGIVRPMQAFATGDDFPASVLEVLERFHQTTYYDLGYEEIFDMKDIRNSKRASIDISDVTSGLTFAKTEIGERAQLYKMSGQKTTITTALYSGGLHWSKILFDDEEYWTLEDNAIAFRNKFFSSKAQDFYDLIEAISATYDLAWQPGQDTLVAGTEGYTVQRDIKTINTAAVNIITRVKDLGFGVGPTSPFKILAPLELKDRLTNALTNVFQAYTGSPNRLQYNVTPIYTTMLSDATKYYMILPKQKLIGLERMDLTILTDMDITTYAELAVGWARYGGAVAEEKQLVRCETE